jgi:hypothetical protein
MTLESWDDAGDELIPQTEFHNGDDGGILLEGGGASAHVVRVRHRATSYMG